MKKIKPSDLEAEAQRFIDAGEMPSLETRLQVIAETREEHRAQIPAARNPAKLEAR